MNPILFPGPKTYQKVSDLYRSDSLTRLRQDFLEIINAHSVPYAENLVKTNDWINYLYYCSLVRFLVPDQSALIIDWGGLYGHITKILQAMGYENVFNYLLHKTPHYPFFEAPLHIPTKWGEDPNRFSLDSNSVDVFISSGVLEHVREDGIGEEEMILREIHRVLKDRGLLFIWNLPAKLGTSELLAMATGKWHHPYRYWKKDILHLLRQADFDLLYFDRHKFFPGSLMTFIEKRIDPLLLLKADNRLSHLFPFNLLARDFVLVARKLSVSI
jgi:SAM-dependent methyltransferase